MSFNMSMMLSSNTPEFMVPPDYSEQIDISNTNQCQPIPCQNRNTCQGPVAILWDIENCPVPSDVRSEDVAGNIRMALRLQPVTDGAVTLFSAYGDFNGFPRRLREGCQRTGVKLVDVPNGRKDAADKAILVDMFLFALDNRPPSSIVLISGDVDFAPALHILGQRGYTIVLVIPAGVGVSSALCNAGRFVWDWPRLARGEGFSSPTRTLLPPRSGPSEATGHFIGYQTNDISDGQNEEESIVYKGVSKSYYNMRDYSALCWSSSEQNNSSMPLSQNCTSSRSHAQEPSSRIPVSGEQNDSNWVQPGDIDGLKGQLVKLLEISGGMLPLLRLPAEYQKLYGRPLYVSEYGAFKLVKLLSRMADAISVEGKGQRRFIYLRNAKSRPVVTPVILARKNKKEKGSQEDSADVAAVVGSSDGSSDDDRVGGETSNLETVDSSIIFTQNLDKFKCELQEILVSYSCPIVLGYFEAIYQQRYKRQLDYESFGVNHLGELLEKVRDVVTFQEEPISKRKYLIAVGG